VSLEPKKSQFGQLADILREAITRGEYGPGAALPSEPELAARYGVSRPTVNRAILILRNEGLVHVERGRGTFVREVPPIPRFANRRYTRAARERGQARGAFDTEIRQLGFEPSSDLVLVGEIAPPTMIAEALQLSSGKSVLVRKRHMFASQTPVQLATSYVPWSIAQGTQLEQKDTGPGGTYSRLAELGHAPSRFTETLRARTPSDEESAFLRLTEGQLVIEILHIAWDAKDKPVEVTVHVLPTHQWLLHYEWSAEPS